MPGHKEEDLNQLVHLMISRMDGMAAQIKALALAQPVVRPTATPPQKEEVQKPKVNHPVLQLFVCECCSNEGHDASTCQSLATDFTPGENFIEEVDYVKGRYQGGNQSGYQGSNQGQGMNQGGYRNYQQGKGSNRGGYHTNNQGQGNQGYNQGYNQGQGAKAKTNTIKEILKGLTTTIKGISKGLTTTIKAKTTIKGTINCSTTSTKEEVTTKAEIKEITTNKVQIKMLIKNGAIKEVKGTSKVWVHLFHSHTLLINLKLVHLQMTFGDFQLHVKPR